MPSLGTLAVQIPYESVLLCRALPEAQRAKFAMACIHTKRAEVVGKLYINGLKLLLAALGAGAAAHEIVSRF
jgi:hypothetical protein